MTLIRDVMRKLRGLMFRYVPWMISCAEFEEFILDYLDDRLSPRQKTIFELHLKVCPDCRSYLAAYHHTVALGKAVFKSPHAPLPSEVPEELIKAILRARSVRD